MNRRWKLLLVSLSGAVILAGTAVPVLARGNGNGHAPDVAAVSHAPSPKADKPKDDSHVVKGTVQSVAGNVITVRPDKKLNVDSNTKYTAPGKKDASLADVVAGVNIVAQVKKTDAGLLALRVHVLGKPVNRVARAGEVTAYTAGSSITIKDAKGNTTTFTINAETKIILPKGATAILVGDRVSIVGIKDGDKLIATAITVHRERVVEGVLTALTATSITVKPATGDAVTLKVDADTIYVIKGKPAVAVGDTVVVRAIKQDDGSLLAKRVLDGMKRPAKTLKTTNS